MTRPSLPPLMPALAAFAMQWLSHVANAQELPPAPPLPIRIVQAQAPASESIAIGPVLPGLAGLALPAQAPHPDDLPPADASMAVPEGDIEAFARGPVHEAFADVYDINLATSEIVALAPPAAVDELPPEQAPQGDNVQWISGYWSWDSEAKDYLWVSGVWRDAPPGRRWVPGYWAEVTGGFQWVGGFWNNAQSQDLTYLPPPPESLEVGPNVPPPSDDQLWVPGCWNYVSNNYRWSPGYYTPCQPDYMWIPNQYNWTPRGCVYVPGYWDYRFARRGTLFSPVRFRRSLAGYGYGRPACYRPQYSVNMSSFLIHLFVRPRCRNFYYGDYYGNQYAGQGFTPWYRRTIVNRRCYDPAYNFYRADSRRQGHDFGRSVDSWHRRFESNVDIRPPRLMQDQAQFQARHQGNRAADLAVLTHRFDDVVKSSASGNRFHRMDRNDLDLLRENNKVNHQLETARRQVERDVRLVKSGDLQPGQTVDLRLKAPRERDALRGSRGAVDGTPAAPEKLILNEMPEKLREKARDSVAIEERIRQRAEHNSSRQPSIGSPLDTARERASERIQIREQATLDRQRERDVRSGPAPQLTPPANDPASQPLIGGRAQDHKADAAARRQELQQSLEEHRVAREAQRQNSRTAPTPDEVERRQPSAVERAPRIEGGATREHVTRERPVFNRNDSPAPVVRQQPVERAPRNIERQIPMERSAPMIRQQPIERAPRNVERQIPVERSAPVIRQQPIERAPRNIERQAPMERAPRQERQPSGRQSSGQRRGRD